MTRRAGLNGRGARGAPWRRGAVVLDPADLPSIVADGSRQEHPATGRFAWAWGHRGGQARGELLDCALVNGMKRDFNRLARVAWQRRPSEDADRAARVEPRARCCDGTLRYGQDQLDASDAIDSQGDRARYEADRARATSHWPDGKGSTPP